LIQRGAVLALLSAPLCVAQSRSSGCLPQTKSDLRQDAAGMVKALGVAPHAALEARNLKWELPIAAATTILIITSADDHTVGSVTSVASDSNKASNVGFGAEILLGISPYLVGCIGGREHARRAGFAALEGAAYALGVDGLL
jgi:hypothetical protein